MRVVLSLSGTGAGGFSGDGSGGGITAIKSIC